MAKSSRHWRLLELVRLPGDINTLLGMLGLSAAISVATGALIQWIEQKPYWAILGACFVFACLMHAAYYGSSLFRQYRVFRNLRRLGIFPIDLGIDTEKKLINPTFAVKLFNSGQRVLYVRIKRAHNSFGLRVSPHDSAMAIASPFLPGAEATMNFTTIPDVDVPSDKNPTTGRLDPVKGKLDFEIEYGTDPDRLNYVLRYQADVHIYIDWPLQPKNEGFARWVSYQLLEEHDKAG